jgi:hypothetical protein
VRGCRIRQTILKLHILAITILLLSVSSFFIQAQSGPPSSEASTSRKWLILPGGASGGSISAKSTEGDLIHLYGKENVVPHDVDIGEGETEPGTELFPSDPLRQADVIWKDANKKSGPKSVQIWGKKSLWRTVHDISLGTTLKQLEQLNRKPFRLAGFAFDYSGTVLSWSGGALEQELGQGDRPDRVILRLDRSRNQMQQSDYNSLIGDKPFSSAHPAMQRLNPTVYQLIWRFL